MTQAASAGAVAVALLPAGEKAPQTPKQPAPPPSTDQPNQPKQPNQPSGSPRSHELDGHPLMGLIVLAADKGAPGVTTAAVALGAVWPRPVLLAECDQAGGDLVYRLPAEGGGMLNPARGLLSLAATARRGLRAEQVWEHTQRLSGGLDVLVGLTSAEQAQGLTWLWSPLGRAFANLPRRRRGGRLWPPGRRIRGDRPAARGVDLIRAVHPPDPRTRRSPA